MARDRLLSLTQLTAYVDEKLPPDRRITRAALQKRCIRGELGQKVGNQWVIAESEAKALVETLGR